MSGLDPDNINWFVPKVALILALEAEVNAPADTNLSLIWADADTIPASKALIATLDKEPDISSAICADDDSTPSKDPVVTVSAKVLLSSFVKVIILLAADAVTIPSAKWDAVKAVLVLSANEADSAYEEECSSVTSTEDDIA